MNPDNQIPVIRINVGIDFGTGTIPVGTLARRDPLSPVFFQYDRDFAGRGLEISPYFLPLAETGVIQFDRDLFDGLPGVFHDSLPDGWGRLLMKRRYGEMADFDMLAHMGRRGMGALVYEPDNHAAIKSDRGFTLDSLGGHVQKIIAGEASEALAEIVTIGGSPGGARPKAIIGVNAARDYIIHTGGDIPSGYAQWLVKFPNAEINDGADAGAMEYVYALMAKEAGIEMPDVHLFPAGTGAGYFAVKLFDRTGGRRLHMHSACGLLHSSFRLPSLDYGDLIRHVQNLTRDMREAEKLYRLAVFNVLAHNRDDHAKNFGFLMDADGAWTLAPAYDLTFCLGPGGEQSTMVMGEGRNPGARHLTELGKHAGLDAAAIKQTIERVQDSLARWPTLAKEHGVRRETIGMVSESL